ncbi:helix-turn-helix transcriptional regulator [Agromyces atrinae]|uniref:Putative DNA-binding transcriptional regulator YafY n=1 Tax=Agromyces atrinae TaxID=592376 RepID=A0A4Q2M9Y9_9MICO|nr:WYL domain-containing protein [Agromyces atrinae]NYD67570.1 putative DNA-binding transcriptional regulator YafY [Agromyces atrinae]RXZ88217.1 WYL domain-containing protein [Agromyces atrinae]
MNTTSRLLTLLSLLQMRRDWPGAVLADRLAISHRTVRRDVERLRAMGYRIEATMGPDGGYRLEAGSELPPLLFDDDQAVAIAVALRSATVSGVGIEDASLRALTTVKKVMPSRLRHRLDALEFTAVPRADGDRARVEPEVLVTISSAIRAREVLRFDYAVQATDDGAYRPSRSVEPQHLVTHAGHWYLVAWDRDRDAWRTFRVDRLTPRTPTGPRFEPRALPTDDVAAYLQAQFRGSTSTAWPCTGTVILHRPAAEVLPFAGDGIVEDAGPDRTRLTAGSWSWIALAASLLRFDAELDVVEPPELIDAFAELSARAARAAVPSAIG